MVIELSEFSEENFDNNLLGAVRKDQYCIAKNVASHGKQMRVSEKLI